VILEEENLELLPVRARVAASLAAVGCVWLVSAGGSAVSLRDGSVFLPWLVWSSIFFAAGWVLVGFPLIALGERATQLPLVLLLLLVVGWFGGMALVLLPGVIVGMLSPQVHFAPLTWEYLRGWPSMGGALGLVTVALYRVLLGIAASEMTAGVNSTVN
jgi:hypothetical protein